MYVIGSRKSHAADRQAIAQVQKNYLGLTPIEHKFYGKMINGNFSAVSFNKQCVKTDF